MINISIIVPRAWFIRAKSPYFTCHARYAVALRGGHYIFPWRCALRFHPLVSCPVFFGRALRLDIGSFPLHLALVALALDTSVILQTLIHQLDPCPTRCKRNSNGKGVKYWDRLETRDFLEGGRRRHTSTRGTWVCPSIH